jgi:hypothetical protein
VKETPNQLIASAQDHNIKQIFSGGLVLLINTF